MAIVLLSFEVINRDACSLAPGMRALRPVPHDVAMNDHCCGVEFEDRIRICSIPSLN